VPPRPHVPDRLRAAPFRGSAAIHAGLLTRAQLAGPRWRRLLPDIYSHTDLPLDHFTWCEAAALVLPGGAAIAGRSAAYVFNVHILPLGDPPVEVAVPTTTSLRRHPRLLIRRTDLCAGEVRRIGNLPLTTPLRTAFDLARQPDLFEAVVGVDAMVASRLVTLPELVDFAAGRRGLRGGAHARRVLALASPGAESPMETRLRLILVLAGLPQPVVQHEVRGATGGLIARLDLAYPAVQVAIEYDGDHHRERDRFRRDVARLNRLRLLGWTVLRFTADDVLRRPEHVVAQVRAILNP
jgi:Protein of unknown function (DUF559)